MNKGCLLGLSIWILLAFPLIGESFIWPPGPVEPHRTPLNTAMGLAVLSDNEPTLYASQPLWAGNIVYSAGPNQPFVAPGEKLTVATQRDQFILVLRQREFVRELYYWDADLNHGIDPRTVLPVLSAPNSAPPLEILADDRQLPMDSWEKVIRVDQDNLRFRISEGADRWSIPKRIVVLSEGAVVLDRYLGVYDRRPDADQVGRSGLSIGVVSLRPGTNDIEVLWTDYSGKESTRSLIVEY